METVGVVSGAGVASGVGVGVLEGSGAADGRTEGEGAGFTDGFTACTVGAGVTTTAPQVQRGKEIIARDSYCGDAEEQDYVEALPLHEVAEPFQDRFLFHR